MNSIVWPAKTARPTVAPFWRNRLPDPLHPDFMGHAACGRTERDGVSPVFGPSFLPDERDPSVWPIQRPLEQISRQTEVNDIDLTDIR